MSIRVLQALAGLFALAAVLLVLVGWRLASSVSQQTSVPGGMDGNTDTAESSETVPGYPALVAVNEMPSGHLVREQDLTLVDFPFTVSLGVSDNNALVGQVLSRPVKAGSVVRHSDFEAFPGLGSEMQAGMRGVAIAVDEIVGVGSHLVPGDLVDVHFVSAASASRQSGMGRTLFQNIRVLGVGSEYLLSQTVDEDSGNGRSARSVVLEVPEKLSPLLTLAETSGVLRLALIGYDEVQERKLKADLMEGESLNVMSAGLSSLTNGNFFQLSDLSALSSGNQSGESGAGRDAEAEEIIVIQHVGNAVSRVSLSD